MVLNTMAIVMIMMISRFLSRNKVKEANHRQQLQPFVNCIVIWCSNVFSKNLDISQRVLKAAAQIQINTKSPKPQLLA